MDLPKLKRWKSECFDCKHPVSADSAEAMLHALSDHREWAHLRLQMPEPIPQDRRTEF